MAPKGGTFFLLLIVACAAMAKRPNKIPGNKPEFKPEFKYMTTKLLRKCLEKGYPVPKKEELKTVFNNSDSPTEDRNTFLIAFMRFLDSAVPAKDSPRRPPSDDSDKTINMMWNCSNLPAVIKLMMNSSEASACYMHAFLAPLSWETLTEQCENIEDSNDYETLLSASKPVLEGKPSTRVKLPPKVDRKTLKKMMKILHEVHKHMPKHVRTRVVKWAKQQFISNNFNCTMGPPSDSRLKQMERCSSSLKWLDLEGLTLMGPFLSCLPPKNVDYSPKKDLCEFFCTAKFRAALGKNTKINPSLANKFLTRFQECFSGKKEFEKHVEKLGPLACYYDADPDMTPDLSRKLFSELKDCDNPRSKKLKRHFVKSVMSKIPVKDLKKFLNDLGQNVRLTKRQQRKLIKRLMPDGKCIELSSKELRNLSLVVGGLPVCVLKHVKDKDILNDEEAQKTMSKSMSKGQLKAFLQGLRKGVDVSELLKKLNSDLLQYMSLSELAQANITSLDQVKGKTLSRSQALYLLNKMAPKRFKKWLGSTLQGVTCMMINKVADKDVKEMSQTITKTPRFISKVLAGCAAKKLFKTLEKTRAEYFKSITEMEMDEIPTFLLIHLPPAKVKDLPASVCPVFLNKMEEANLTSLPRHSPSRPALARRALLCLGEDISNLTTEDVSSLGQLLCELPPSQMHSMAPDVLNSSLQDMVSCQHIPKRHRADLIQLLTKTFGKPSAWSEETMEELGPLLLLDDDAIFALPNEPWMRDVLYFLKPRLALISHALKKKLFKIITSSASRKKREANSDSTGEVLPTVKLIEELEQENSLWGTKDLDRISDETFRSTVVTLGDVYDYSADQLAVLCKKAIEVFGPVSQMTENDVSQMGCITRGFSNTELEKLAFSLDTLEEISPCGWQESQMEPVWRGVAKHNNLKAEELGAVEMVTLSRFICGLNSSEIKQLNRDAFKNAVGSMDDAECSFTVTNQLKNLAVSVFGDVNTWTEAQVSDLGNIVAGLDKAELTSLDPSVCPFIEETCIPLIPPENFAALSLSHLEYLGPDNAARVTSEQRAALTDEQLSALERAMTGSSDQTQRSGQSGASSQNVEGISAFMKPLLVLLTGFLLL